MPRFAVTIERDFTVTDRFIVEADHKTDIGHMEISHIEKQERDPNYIPNEHGACWNIDIVDIEEIGEKDNG